MPALVAMMDDEILEKMPEWMRILRKAVEEKERAGSEGFVAKG